MSASGAQAEPLHLRGGGLIGDWYVARFQHLSNEPKLMLCLVVWPVFARSNVARGYATAVAKTENNKDDFNDGFIQE
jgi:hypothetical protein